ncbi:MAG: hypothetical protein ACRYF5_06115 [Janthinobacterium lividum]
MRVLITVVTNPTVVPAGVTGIGQLRYSILNADGTPFRVQLTNDISSLFTQVPAAQYSMEVARLDNNGAVVGQAITAPLSVTAPPVDPTLPADPPILFDAPTTITAIVTPDV